MEAIDLQELIQDDIITYCCACDHDVESELVDDLFQIVVDRTLQCCNALKNLQELIQGDIITCCWGHDHNLEGSELVDDLCQIVVDRMRHLLLAENNITNLTMDDAERKAFIDAVNGVGICCTEAKNFLEIYCSDEGVTKEAHDSIDRLGFLLDAVHIWEKAKGKR